MTDKQIIDCEYLKIDEMRTCKAFDVNFYGDIICNEEDCIILNLKQQLKTKEQECEELKKVTITLAEGLNFRQQLVEKLKQTLAKIKEIAEKRNYLDYNECLDDILQKISECEVEQ